MTLPGKIAVCYLEEDVPQKAYFRIKPLYVKDEGTFMPMENASEALPDEGGIRIVPDKNESSRFKARMRTLGSFCLLNLTQHPNENDKIRPNKNYSPEKMENNRNIVYADVIERCPAEWLMEVVRVDNVQDGGAKAFLNRKIGTECAALISDGVLSFPYTYTVNENGEYTFTKDETAEHRAAEENAFTRLMKVNPAGEEIEIILTAGSAPLFKKTETEAAQEEKPAAAEEATGPACQSEEANKEEPKPSEEIKPEEAAPIDSTEAHAPEEKKAEKTEPEKKPAEKPEAEKPAVPVRAHMRDTSAETLQTGLNPRRGKSLAEVVDDGWRKSRMDQFGAPIPVNVTGMPVVSPVEHAAETLKKAWQLKEARLNIAREILKLEDFADAVAPIIMETMPQAAGGAQAEKLNSLTAEKLKILTEIDEIRLRRMEKRTELMDEVKKVYAGEIKKLEDAVASLRSQKQKAVKEAEDAREALAIAKKLLNDTLKDSVKSDLMKFVYASRLPADDGMAELEADYARAPETYEPNGAQLISDIRMMFEKANNPISNDEAVNLLASLALGRFVIFSGATGCGKTTLARDLANALGLTTSGRKRFAMLEGAIENAVETPAFRALTANEDGESLRLILLDDMNNTPALNQSRGLIGWFEENTASALRVVMTAMDDQLGYPVNPRIWDRAFTLRLEKRDTLNASEVEPARRTVSLETLKKIFTSVQSLPAEVEERLSSLTEKLASLNQPVSERTLRDIRAYCAGVLPYMTCTPMEILDYALCARAVPYILATAKMSVLEKLPEIFCDLPRSLSLMNHPLPLPPME